MLRERITPAKLANLPIYVHWSKILKMPNNCQTTGELPNYRFVNTLTLHVRVGRFKNNTDRNSDKNNKINI